MLKKLPKLVLPLLFLTFSACTSNNAKEEVSTTNKVSTENQSIQSSVQKVKKHVDALILKAEASRKKAASVGGEWRDIGKFIKQAKFYQVEGRCEKAIKTLQKAIDQSEMGYAQIMKQKDNYIPSYMKF